MSEADAYDNMQVAIDSSVARMGLDVEAMTPAATYQFARRQARAMRQAGMHPERIHAVLVESLLGWITIAIADFHGPKYSAHRVAVEEGIAHGLADRPRRALSPLARQRRPDIQGVDVELADGQVWRFPELAFDRLWLQTPSGVERVGYEWESTKWGDKAGRLFPALMRIHVDHKGGLASINAVFREILAFCSSAIRANYRINRYECFQLMPIDVENPRCMAEVVSIITGSERLEVKSLGVCSVVQRFIYVRRDLQAYIAPVFQDYLDLIIESGDCEE